MSTLNQTAPHRCANCGCTENVSSKSTLRLRPDVEIRKVLSVIGYSLPFKDQLDDELLVVCRSCDEILYLLHHLYHHFKDIRQPGSFLDRLNNGFNNNEFFYNEAGASMMSQEDDDFYSQSDQENESPDNQQLTETGAGIQFEADDVADSNPLEETILNNVSIGTLIPIVEMKIEEEVQVQDNFSSSPTNLELEEWRDSVSDELQVLESQTSEMQQRPSKQSTPVQRKPHRPKSANRSLNIPTRYLRRRSMGNDDTIRLKRTRSVSASSPVAAIQNAGMESNRNTVSSPKSKKRRTGGTTLSLGQSADGESETIPVRSSSSPTKLPTVPSVAGQSQRRRGRPSKKGDKIVESPKATLNLKSATVSITRIDDKGIKSGPNTCTSEDTASHGDDEHKKVFGTARNMIPSISEQLKIQLKKAGKRKTKIFPCIDCSRTQKTSSALLQHVRLTHGRRFPYNCSKCDREFKSLTMLFRHCDKMHGGSPAKTLKCPRVGCKKSFVFKAELHQHLHYHATVKRKQEELKQQQQHVDD